MDFFAFERTLLRVKEALGVRADKEVAEFLGMDVSALNKRKARGSFPEKELRALAQERPELGIDVDWVLLGSMQDRQAAAAAAVAEVDAYARQVVAQLTEGEPAIRPEMTEQESTLVWHWKRCRPSDQQLLVVLAASLAEKSDGAR